MVQYFPVTLDYTPEKIQSVEELIELRNLYVEKGLEYNLEEHMRRRELAIQQEAERKARTGTTSTEAMKLKNDLLAEINALQIPPAPLDALIDGFG